MLKTLLSKVGEYKLPSILTPVFTGAEVVMELLIPYIIASLIDKGITAGNMQNVLKYGSAMLCIAMFSLLFGILAGRFAARSSTGFAKNLRDAMFENIQTFSFSNIDKYSPSGLITRMTTDVTNLQNAYQMCLRIAVRSPLMLIFSLIMCLTIHGKTSLIFIAALAVLAFALTFIVKNATQLFSQVFRKYDALNASVQENVSAIRVVKAFVREDYEDQKFCTAAGNVAEMFRKAEKYIVLNGPIMSLVVYGCIAALSWFGAHYILAGEITTGNLTSLFSYVMNVLMSLMMLSMVFVMLTMSQASGRRIAEILDEKADITNPAEPVFEVPDGSIDFDDVSFRYKAVKPIEVRGLDLLAGKKGKKDKAGSSADSDGKSISAPDKASAQEDTLQHIDLHIHSGETIGIIGGTGCGKSTLVSLVSRLYDADAGSVKVGGIDVRNYDLTTLRDAVSVVLQKNTLFSGTVLDNLRWGKNDATEEECRHAAHLACADEFIEDPARMPDGYQTVIEQGGTNVSGGQRQRLCIARALLKSPKILILDDSTSACDTATEAKIQRAFREEIPDTTKIIISQRISSVQNADRIIVMDDGKIDAFDTHDNLLETNAIYREIFESQISGGDFDKPE